MVKNIEIRNMKETGKKRRRSTHSVSPAWGDSGGAGGAGGVGVAGGTGVGAGGMFGAVGCGSSIGLNWVPVLVRSCVYCTTGPLLLTAPTGKRKLTTEKMRAVSLVFMHTPHPHLYNIKKSINRNILSKS